MANSRRLDHAGWISEHDPLPVSVWRDPLYDKLGHDPRSDYVETYWLAILGPTAVLAARRLVDWLEERPDGLEIPLEPLARSLGISGSTARNAPLVRTLTRLVDFGLARVDDGAFLVRTAFPPLARRQVVRLPAYLAERHTVDLVGQSPTVGSPSVGVTGDERARGPGRGGQEAAPGAGPGRHLPPRHTGDLGVQTPVQEFVESHTTVEENR